MAYSQHCKTALKEKLDSLVLVNLTSATYALWQELTLYVHLHEARRTRSEYTVTAFGAGEESASAVDPVHQPDLGPNPF